MVALRVGGTPRDWMNPGPLSLGDVDAGVAIPIRTRVVASERGWTHFERRIGGVGVCDTLQGAER